MLDKVKNVAVKLAKAVWAQKLGLVCGLMVGMLASHGC